MPAPIDLARDAAERADWPAALEHWRAAHELDPEGFWPRYWIAGSLSRLNRYTESIPLLMDLATVATGSNLCVVRQLLTENFLQLKEPDAALEQFRLADAMGLAEEKVLHRLAIWIIRERLLRGFPESVFELPQDLFRRVSIPA